MLSFIVIGLVAFASSTLTLFSGFGLGTILMPAFAIFFPLSLAIALTAVVHLLNNIFKFFLVGRKASLPVVWQFGLPAVVASFVGAKILVGVEQFPALYTYMWQGHEFSISWIKLLIAALIIVFTLLELNPRWTNLSFERKYLPWGGILSGFLGGLSGHQGALRSAFLLKCGLSKESFIATGVVIACLVDISRLAIYAGHFSEISLRQHTAILIAAILFAFAGAFLGNRWVKKITMPVVQRIVSWMLIVIALLLGCGLI